jgi:hypothetical protein
MRVYVEPAISQWRLPARSRVQPADRRELLAQALDRACDAPDAPEDRRPILATGHQAWLWHPGILAKDIAIRIAADRAGAGGGATLFHVVVDHDPTQALRLEVPVRAGEALGVQAVALGRYDPRLPPCLQSPPEGMDSILQVLDEWSPRSLVDLTALRQALVELREGPPSTTLAQWVTRVTMRLIRPIAGDIPVVMSSELLGTTAGRALVGRLRADAAAAVRAYNAAVARHPQAGVTPLAVERERVELPLWELSREHHGDPERARQRVFADLADSTPMLVREDGAPIALASKPAWLAPRALTLTALLRSVFCDRFVHGRGGGVYDRVAEDWWLQWTGQALAPMAVATADLYLDVGGDVPMSGPGDVAQAVWYAHHVPHNLDRVLPPAGIAQADRALIREKHAILAHMDDDRDPRRRREAFARLHALNAELANAHTGVVVASREAVTQARAGVGNQAVARKRDWCLGLYPAAQLRALRDVMQTHSMEPRMNRDEPG